MLSLKLVNIYPQTLKFKKFWEKEMQLFLCRLMQCWEFQLEDLK